MPNSVRKADTSAAAALGQLPTVQSIEKWTAVELLSFILSRNILQNDESRERFEELQIDGNSFLRFGGTIRFWQAECQLQIAPSIQLATLMDMIKGIG